MMLSSPAGMGVSEIGRRVTYQCIQSPSVDLTGRPTIGSLPPLTPRWKGRIIGSPLQRQSPLLVADDATPKTPNRVRPQFFRGPKRGHDPGDLGSDSFGGGRRFARPKCRCRSPSLRLHVRGRAGRRRRSRFAGRVGGGRAHRPALSQWCAPLDSERSMSFPLCRSARRRDKSA